MGGTLYATILFLGVNHYSTMEPIITVERNVFYREKVVGSYSAFAYALAQVSHISLFHFILYHTFHIQTLYVMTIAHKAQYGPLAFPIQEQALGSMS